MSEELPERGLLRHIDPAPPDITAERRAAHLQMVLRDVDRRASRRTAPRARWLVLPVVLTAAAAVAVGVLLLPGTMTGIPPSGPSEGGGTAMPDAITVGTTTPSGRTILAEASVGTTQILLGTKDGTVYSGASFDGSDPDANWSSITGIASPRPDGATVLTAGNSSGRDADGVAYMGGRIGADVSAVTVTTDAGQEIEASVNLDAGCYLAAWDGDDFTDRSTLGAVLTLHMRDGTTSEVSYLDMTE
jgi:hypothetical protein